MQMAADDKWPCPVENCRANLREEYPEADDPGQALMIHLAEERDAWHRAVWIKPVLVREEEVSDGA